MLIVLLLFSVSPRADLILLKSGGVMEGEVLSESSDSIEFKIKSGVTEEIKRNLIASIVKEEELPLNPEETYLQKVKLISPSNAKAHYELGLFCMENSMFNYAYDEFNRAKEIDTNYEKLVFKKMEYINSVKEEAEKMTSLKRIPEAISSLTSSEIDAELKKGNLVMPLNKKDAEIIAGAMKSFTEQKTKEVYAKKYLELGDSFIEKAKNEKLVEDNYITLQTALFCYNIAGVVTQNSETKFLSEQKFRDTTNSLEEIKKARFVVPNSAFKRDAIILFIRGLDDTSEKNSYASRYYYMGGEFEAKVKGASLDESDRENLETALRCYEIVKNSHIRDILGRSLIEARIQECKKRLGK